MKLGPYQLLRRVAAGGMAEVFLARRSGPAGFAKLVAVKRILPHLDEAEWIDMFLAEARLLARFDHPGVVQAFDVGLVAHRPWLAMEYVHGEDLISVCRRAAERDLPVPAPLAAEIAAQAADALHYVHELRGDSGLPLRIIHRDVTPSNLLLSCDGALKLCDFGVAAVGVEGDPGMVKGTRSYMAPEQRAGETLDRRADVYALGVVLWELLAHRRLRRRDDAHDDADDDASVPPLPADVPAGLAAVCRRALAPRREDRFPDAAAVAAALEPFRPARAHARDALRGYLDQLHGPDAAVRARAALPPELSEPTRPLRPAPRRRRRSLIPYLIVAAALALWLGAALRGRRSVEPAERAEIRLALPSQK